MSDSMSIVGLDDVGQMNTPVDNIGGEVVNLIFVAVDGSGSMSGYVKDMNDCLDNFKTSISNSKEADDILVARADFASTISVSGYKKIDQLDTSYSASGNTALYDVITEGVKKLNQYMDYLKNQGIRVKAVFSVFSDGEDTCSRNPQAAAKTAIDILNKNEITTAFICFGNGAMGEAKTLNFKNVLNVASSASELRKAFDVLSKSVISSSKSVVNNSQNFFTL